MQIILLSDKEQKEELIAPGEDMPEGIIWSPSFQMPEEAKRGDAVIDLLFDDTAERITKLHQLQTQIIIINSVIKPLHELGPGLIRMNGWNTFLKRQILEASGDDSLKKKGDEVFSFLNKKVEWVADITGFISLRVVASIINEAYFALEQQVSSKEEIDTAMKLGTNYPYGPFEWSEKIGLKNIYSLLRNLTAEQKRYEPAALLTKEATG
jgi:3-hydroxybutyryl-CoA dehydrogenase